MTLVLFADASLAADGPLPPPIPKGASVIQQSPDFILYRNIAGQERMIFRASSAWSARVTRRGRNYTTPSAVTIVRTPEGPFPYVIEGMHRTAGAARGDAIGIDLGGTASAGWLDFPFRRGERELKPEMRRVTELVIDYTQPDVSAAESDRINQEKLDRCNAQIRGLAAGRPKSN